MAMLKKRMLMLAIIHELPKLAVAACRTNKELAFFHEIENFYRQLGIYDNIIDRIKIGGII